MSLSTPELTLPIRRLVESRPPAVSWPSITLPVTPPDQPVLDLSGPGEPDPSARPDRGVRGTVVRARWTVRPRPDLPDAREWSASLTVAVVQALLAQRPIAQLNRWLADEVLGAVTLQQRRRRAGGRHQVVPVVLRSLRVQHPHPEVAEVSAHVVVGKQSTALALRLEALGHRWIGTALEVDPRVFR